MQNCHPSLHECIWDRGEVGGVSCSRRAPPNGFRSLGWRNARAGRSSGGGTVAGGTATELELPTEGPGVRCGVAAAAWSRAGLLKGEIAIADLLLEISLWEGEAKYCVRKAKVDLPMKNVSFLLESVLTCIIPAESFQHFEGRCMHPHHYLSTSGNAKELETHSLSKVASLIWIICWRVF
jgi:hypothetical protein